MLRCLAGIERQIKQEAKGITVVMFASLIAFSLPLCPGLSALMVVSDLPDRFPSDFGAAVATMVDLRPLFRLSM